MLTPFNRAALRRDVGGRRDNFNFYLSQLRINIECCFGMLINKFPILESALKTPLLRNAVDTFHVCCILHNLCIDERLSNNTHNIPNSFPPGRRYTQFPRINKHILKRSSDFEYVPIVDELTAFDSSSSNRIEPTNILVRNEFNDEHLSRKEKIVLKISRSGYVRPQRRRANR